MHKRRERRKPFPKKIQREEEKQARRNDMKDKKKKKKKKKRRRLRRSPSHSRGLPIPLAGGSSWSLSSTPNPPFSSSLHFKLKERCKWQCPLPPRSEPEFQHLSLLCMDHFFIFLPPEDEGEVRPFDCIMQAPAPASLITGVDCLPCTPRAHTRAACSNPMPGCTVSGAEWCRVLHRAERIGGG
ncbi:hypothetical protein CEXT_196111 [Caerostris extrusa]|uniref:Uncharacterized protein n=1 Tax=Caerostris extrusa TaxID=172846 RepID=A0AAV4WJE2_CAEEX|nr:hypothetical protein CEXT_196111 [Caerostris extrusa]